MQTFLPFQDFQQTAAVLDDKRLGKQRVETYQVALQLLSVKMLDWDSRTWEPKMGGWLSHPVIGMWSGHELALLEYQRAICDEFTRRGVEAGRGHTDTCLPKTEYIIETLREPNWSPVLPAWVTDSRVHESHRANLLRKEPEYYKDFAPITDVDLPYFWPETSGTVERAEEMFKHAAEVRATLDNLPTAD